MNTIEKLKLSLDPILAMRTKLGADLRKVYLITREWSGDQIGDGTVIETSSEVLPTPGIKDYSHSLRGMEGGFIKQGDLIIYHISKNVYPLETALDGTSDNPSIDKLYKIGDFYYRAISVVEKLLTWDVHVRRLSDQTTRG